MSTQRNRAFVTSVLWLAQGLLTVLFLMSGFGKLFSPDEQLAELFAPIPATFMRFIGAMEVLGALGLILPGLLRLRPGLTHLAAAGLLLIMIAATIYTAAALGAAPAVMPLTAGVLCAFVAYGRWRLAPLHGRDRAVGARLEGRPM
jgi:uncharacterized membrane protein YphA (DoxX/SURF4 family)